MTVPFGDQARSLLSETVRLLFPLQVDPASIVKPHVWRDRNYGGEVNERVVSSCENRIFTAAEPPSV